MTDADGENQLVGRELFSIIQSHREAVIVCHDGGNEPLLDVRNETLLKGNAVGDEGLKRYGQTDVSIVKTVVNAELSETERTSGIVN
ncbi:MAG: hypothetical protein WAK12_00845 [Acidimicrobiales bacterium]